MKLYNIIVADPPYLFDSPLKMKDGVNRSAESQYSSIMTTEDIINLDIKSIVADDAILALWVPSALLAEGLAAMKNYGFSQKQSFIWIKVKKNPFKTFIKNFIANPIEAIKTFDLNSILGFNMGHCFRNTHEICLIGTRGKILSYIQNRSQRTVAMSAPEDINENDFLDDMLVFDESMKHSKKTEKLQDSLDLMFPDVCFNKKNEKLEIKKIELFARRERKGYLCIGNQCKNKSFGEDIREVLQRIKAGTYEL